MSDPTMFPFFRYVDAAAAIDWLERAFGFETHMAHKDDDGQIVHAELAVGSGLIMLGSDRDDALKVRSPRVLGGASAGVYFVIENVDAHCDRAKAAGAEIVRGPEDMDYGSREYTARDPEGNVWSFGTYTPAA